MSTSTKVDGCFQPGAKFSKSSALWATRGFRTPAWRTECPRSHLNIPYGSARPPIVADRLRGGRVGGSASHAEPPCFTRPDARPPPEIPKSEQTCYTAPTAQNDQFSPGSLLRD